MKEFMRQSTTQHAKCIHWVQYTKYYTFMECILHNTAHQEHTKHNNTKYARAPISQWQNSNIHVPLISSLSISLYCSHIHGLHLVASLMFEKDCRVKHISHLIASYIFQLHYQHHSVMWLQYKLMFSGYHHIYMHRDTWTCLATDIDGQLYPYTHRLNRCAYV